MALEIHEATQADATTLADLAAPVHAAHVDWRPEFFRSVSADELSGLFAQWLGQENFRAYLALLDNRPAGYIAVRIAERPGNLMMHARRFLDIEQIGVLPAKRGKGIGMALLEKVKCFAEERGLSRIELNVWAENANARRAFAAWGFRTQSERMSVELGVPGTHQ